MWRGERVCARDLYRGERLLRVWRGLHTHVQLVDAAKERVRHACFRND